MWTLHFEWRNLDWSRKEGLKTGKSSPCSNRSDFVGHTTLLHVVVQHEMLLPTLVEVTLVIAAALSWWLELCLEGDRLDW